MNPLYLLEIFNDKGKKFFLNYYSEDIEKEFKKASDDLERAQKYKDDFFKFWIDKGYFSS